MENENVNVNEEVQEQAQETKTYTQEEFQSEVDKRVAGALDTQRKKYEKELKKQKSLVGLDEEARARAEKEQQIIELQEQLQEYKLANTKSEIAKVLNNRGLDANLVDFVVTSSDTDECLEKIEALDKIFKAMLKKDRESSLRGSTPKSTVGLDGNITREQFNKMTIKEMTNLKINNPELYKQLTQI